MARPQAGSPRIWFTRLAALVLAPGLAACAAPAPEQQRADSLVAGEAGAEVGEKADEAAGFESFARSVPGEGMSGGVVVVDPATVLQDGWIHMPLHGTTDYRMTYLDGRLAIRAEPRQSASGLIRRVAIDPARCPILEWTWRVERLQDAADLRVKAADDVAASIFLLFGDPGLLSDPDPVPTLRYVWTNGRLARGAVIDNPYLPGTVRSLVVRNGGGPLGAWVSERRDIAADYWRAFGRAPGAPVGAVVLFTDNDQTGEPALAHYGAARALCEE